MKIIDRFFSKLYGFDKLDDGLEELKVKVDNMNSKIVFNKDDKVDDLEPCMKRPIVLHAKQIDKPFLVSTKEGTMSGKAGDYLMKGIDGELYPCNKDIFERTYDFIVNNEEVGFDDD